MEDFEVGRRRPLKRRIEEAFSETISPVHEEMPTKDGNSLLPAKETGRKNTRKKTAGVLRSPESNPHKVLPLIEIDLHIYELVDTTAGMDNYAMLQFQLDTVRKTMKSHSRRIGQKIVFIHGKGDGVLRKEVRALLAKEYASCDVQDASFLKYGFGATEVTVRQR
ncbi:MAG: Smr/MutS family protein [Muribaculaceae bacterium]|nr:Smr/MutS family protein [Muribaculaceae bacterium]